MEFGISRTVAILSGISFSSQSSSSTYRRSCGLITFVPRPNRTLPPSSSVSPKRSIKKNYSNELKQDEDEEAFEAMFSMLEKDLNADVSSNDYNEDITEEDIEMLQDQLEYALGFESENDTLDNDKEETNPNLKTWQLRRLASALKTGRRKISIKSLALELCLDRAVVLQYLRDPPPSLLMMSAAMPDDPEREVAVASQSTEGDEVSGQDESNQVEEPVHAMRQQWSAQKRIKKAHLETLERVYRKSKRPTNAMISSIVLVTNLPRKRVVKWFEDKRSQEDVSKGQTRTIMVVPLTPV